MTYRPNGHRPLKIGHRGAPRIRPANTMASFRAAHDLGCDWIECDCRASADGAVVLSHDEVVTDARGRRWPVNDHPAHVLAGLDLGAGEGVPTLVDLVAWAEGRVGIMADVKEGGLEESIGALLSPIPAACKVVPGADEAGRRRFRALFPDLPVSLSVGAGDEPELERQWSALDTDAVTLEHPLVTSGRIADLHRRGIRVYAWTVDDPDTMRRLAALGVDGIISNRADLLRDLDRA